MNLIEIYINLMAADKNRLLLMRGEKITMILG